MKRRTVAAALVATIAFFFIGFFVPVFPNDFCSPLESCPFGAGLAYESPFLTLTNLSYGGIYWPGHPQLPGRIGQAEYGVFWSNRMVSAVWF